MNLEELVVSVRDRGHGVIAFDDMTAHCIPRDTTFFLHTKSQKTHQALVQLGWTPPGEKAKVRFNLVDFQKTVELMNSYDKLSDLQWHQGADVYLPNESGREHFAFKLSPAELRASIDRQKKEAQDALAKLGIEYP